VKDLNPVIVINSELDIRSNPFVDNVIIRVVGYFVNVMFLLTFGIFGYKIYPRIKG
jgi:hypothetical protein